MRFLPFAPPPVRESQQSFEPSQAPPPVATNQSPVSVRDAGIKTFEAGGPTPVGPLTAQLETDRYVMLVEHHRRKGPAVAVMAGNQMKNQGAQFIVVGQ